jgi:hypothetical protein
MKKSFGSLFNSSRQIPPAKNVESPAKFANAERSCDRGDEEQKKHHHHPSHNTIHRIINPTKLIQSTIDAPLV